MNRNERRELIVTAVRDLVKSFLVYDRKEDAHLPLGEIESAVAQWDITIPEIVFIFEEELRKVIPVPNGNGNSGLSWIPAEEEGEKEDS